MGWLEEAWKSEAEAETTGNPEEGMGPGRDIDKEMETTEMGMKREEEAAESSETETRDLSN